MDPRAAELPHSTAIQLASTEYQRCVELFRSLQPGDWTQPTDCPDWDVREMACHMLGMLEMAASVRENVRQQRLSMRAGGDPLDALTALQVSERRTWTPDRDRRAVRAARAEGGRGSQAAAGIPARPAAAGEPAGERRRRTVDRRLPQRHHLDPRSVDAPDRHLPEPPDARCT